MKPFFHKVTKSLQSSLVVRHDKVDNFGKPVHYHSDLELHLTLKGEGTRYIGNKVDNFSSGDIILIGENLPHSLQAKETGGDGVEAIILQFNKYFLGEDFFDIPEYSHVRTLFDKAKKGIDLHGQTKELVKEKMLEVVEASPFKRVIILLEILDLIAERNEYSTVSVIDNDFNGIDENACRMNKVYNYTFNHFKTDINIAELASICHLTPSSFCRFFKKIHKKTYIDFLIEVRINFACQLILNNKFSVNAICFECGFNNNANFYRQFKRIMGVTPSEYKKQHLIVDAA